MNTRKMTLTELLSLEYSISMVRGEDEYEAWHPEFGRMTSLALGDTPEEALAELNSIRETLITVFHERGMPIPQPATDDRSYSGQLVLRMPQSLHRSLALSAKQEGTSLNQYLVHLLSVQEERATLLRALEKNSAAPASSEATSASTDANKDRPTRKSA